MSTYRLLHLSLGCILAMLMSAALGKAEPFLGRETIEKKPDGWITIQGASCQVFNFSPVENESVTWTGKCVKGKAHGKGTVEWFKDGKTNGRYEGEYHNGKREGVGTFLYPDGSRYTGGWKDDLKHGKGVLYGAEGSETKGEWKQGKQQGRHKMIIIDSP